MGRYHLFLTASAAGLLAVAAAAQESAAPVDASSNSSTSAGPSTGLAGLRDTVSTLSDEPAPAQEPAPRETAQQPSAAPAASPEAAPAPEALPAPTPHPRVPILTGPPQPLSRAETAQLEANVARGRLLGAIARAGQLATQDMLSRIPDPSTAGISGWIAEPEGNGATVTFYADGTAGAPAAAIYRASVLGGRVVSREVLLSGNRPPLTPLQARMATARHIVEGLDHQPCGGQDFNVFVMPPESLNGPIDVYQFSAQTQRGHFPIGGHFRTIVAADQSVSAAHAVTSACHDVVVADPPAGQAPAPIPVTDEADALPTAAHVFMTMWTGHPLIVTAGDPPRRFAVGSSRITELPPPGGQTP
jgi:hypothetical protein